MAEQRDVPNRKLSRPANKASTLGQSDLSTPLQDGELRISGISKDENPKSSRNSSRKFKLRSLLLDWRFVTIAGLILTTSLTTLSIAFILKLPAIPNCPAIFWPLASASIRLHCAQIAASKHNVNDLIEAIELVSGIPNDHPLYAEASRWIEDWSTELLDLAQEKFNTGKLDEAIAAAKKIPAHAVAAKQVNERIANWKKIWSEAESIVTKVDQYLSNRNWKDAFNEATKLLAIDNPYWQTSRYTEISGRIATAKDEITKLSAADRAIEDGGADELLKAYNDLESIPEQSSVYKEVQDLKPRIGQRLMRLAEDAADRGAFDEALRIANKIPDGIKIKQDLDDFIALVSAQSKTKTGDLMDMEEAIAQAERLPSGRPLYARAQMLAARWKTEVRDIAQLNRAKDLARSGSPEGIQAAIAAASNIPLSNPKSKEARDFINQSNTKIQANQDQITLDQANAMAAPGDVASLQTAIGIAQQIISTSPLYNQAQAQIKTWTTSLQSQDSPSPTPTPDPETLTADQSLFAQANALAQSHGGNPDDLLQAIAIAQQVSNASRGQAQQTIDQWSEQVLRAAVGQSAYDQLGAIALVSRIPAGTSAYNQAQSNLTLWKKQIGQH